MRQVNTRLATTVAALTLLVPTGVALAGDGKGKGGEKPQTAPGQEEKAEHAAPPAAGEKAAKPAKQKKSAPAKESKPAKKPAPAAKQKTSKPAKKANPHAKAGKITICHSTSSATNPYVTITMSRNALPAHLRHHEGRDIVPAPAGGCPAPAPAAAATPDAAKPETANAPTKVTICHATGSATNPFVKITIAEAAVAAHREHQDGRDIIPAPAGDCPAPAPATPAAAAGPGPENKSDVAPAGAQAPASAPAPAASVIAAPFAAPQGGVQGQSESGGEASNPSAGDSPASTAAPDTTGRESGADDTLGSGSLPFTGLDTWLLVAGGLALLLAGVAGRRAAANRV